MLPTNQLGILLLRVEQRLNRALLHLLLRLVRLLTLSAMWPFPIFVLRLRLRPMLLARMGRCRGRFGMAWARRRTQSTLSPLMDGPLIAVCVGLRMRAPSRGRVLGVWLALTRTWASVVLVALARVLRAMGAGRLVLVRTWALGLRVVCVTILPRRSLPRPWPLSPLACV